MTRPLTTAEIRTRRGDFPSLERRMNDRPLVYLDGPAGTQVPRQVIDAINSYYTTCNANSHGQFVTTRESDALVEGARSAVADLLGSAAPHQISFGANMTTMTFSLSRALARALRPGDEVLITQLDHEANRGPWLGLREQGITVREIGINRDATLDMADFRAKVNERTRIVAMGWASNAFGTVNDVGLARELTHKVGAWLVVDAVHYAPHFSIDAPSSGIDFLLCSAYKFYGPHVGILYCREGLLEQIATDRLRTQDPRAPHRFETGTLNHAALAGVGAAVEYLASLGKGATRRERLVNGFARLTARERTLGMRLYEGLAAIKGVTVAGVTFRAGQRAPTVSFTLPGKQPEEICARLGSEGICTWDGHFYAIRPMEVLGLLEQGGVTRVGVSLYTLEEEIDRLIASVRTIARS